MILNKRKFNISIGFVLLLSVLFYFDSEQLLFPALGAFLLHELGHMAAIKLCGGMIECINLRVFGARIKLSRYPILSYRSEIIIAAAGPASGLAAAVTASFFARLFDIDGLYTFSGLNLVLTAINLLPIYPLDGGRIVYFLLLLFLDYETAHKISFNLSVLFTVLLMFLCTAVIAYTGFSLTLVIFTAFIAVKMCVIPMKSNE